MDASNATLRAVITHGDRVARCVYKPVAGERPLWDFPDGTLAGREYSAWLLSEATGWGIVPPTVLRDGPLGPGMCQLWIDEDLQSDELLLGFVPAAKVPKGWRRIMSARDEHGRAFVLAHADDPRLAWLAVFDAIANNADRKGGHVIETVDGRVHGVDHGICFHTEDKLRTVLWGWAGRPLPDEAVEVLEKLRAQYQSGLAESLSDHLTPAEVAMVSVRVNALLQSRRFPEPDEDRHAIPWPPI
ncbi:SCO1664 family protein [Dactylosporangium sp. AC04546]|uniref:SCO1664 family protein n=1 Tax=Dactylosporangium sp. AC04546 TaxID=2862460 RepID=UPI002E7C1B78|nr:SCO1664 family protein [Dactylosporangium sp. AC04546]WVK89725.1 SCO1664 family protein [Dactylosporangium sp. AC04546]